MIMLVAAACAVGLLVLAGLIAGLILIMQSGQRDAVSAARQDWIERRSDKDSDW